MSPTCGSLSSPDKSENVYYEFSTSLEPWGRYIDSEPNSDASDKAEQSSMTRSLSYLHWTEAKSHSLCSEENFSSPSYDSNSDENDYEDDYEDDIEF